MKRIIVKIGTRGSKLALWQANYIKNLLTAFNSNLQIEIVPIKTSGDKLLEIQISKIEGKGIFTKEIENALLKGDVDIAVHSLKDLPVDLPEGLTLAAVPERESPYDVLISRYKLNELPKGARIGTSSLRRISQLLHCRNDLTIENIRGNIDTRIKKLEKLNLDGIVVAFAGIKRLNLVDFVSEILPYDIVLPAPGQGAIAVEIRKNDEEVFDIVSKINDNVSYRTTAVERSFLKRIGGGCHIPVGAIAFIENDKIFLQGMMASLDGRKMMKDKIEGRVEQEFEIGEKLAEKLLANGGYEIISDYLHRRDADNTEKNV